jgi:hypothetical protein
MRALGGRAKRLCGMARFLRDPLLRFATQWMCRRPASGMAADFRDGAAHRARDFKVTASANDENAAVGREGVGMADKVAVPNREILQER